MADDFFTRGEFTELKKITLEELTELRDKIFETLQKAEAREASPADLKIYFHTIAGSAAMGGFMEMSRLGADGEKAAGDRNTAPEAAIASLRSLAEEFNRLLSKAIEGENGGPEEATG